MDTNTKFKNQIYDFHYALLHNNIYSKAIYYDEQTDPNKREIMKKDVVAFINERNEYIDYIYNQTTN